MIETELKRKQEAEFTRQHTLTQEDLRKMIAEKFERARALYKANQKREVLLEDR